MDEKETEASLETYKLQLAHVAATVQATDPEENAALVKLKGDLEELVQLTEESLLSLKKSKLLSVLESPGFATSPLGKAQGHAEPSQHPSAIDTEFAAFQAAISENIEGPSLEEEKIENSSPIENTSASTSSQNRIDLTINGTSSSSDFQKSEVDFGEEFKDIAGTKCRAPFVHDWGTFQMHNAMIVGVESLESDQEPKVRVMFCNPTHQAMLPCPYYLDGRCRFKDEDCRYSHGYVVEASKLEEFMDPDYSTLLLDTDCLAKDTDGIWYKSKIVEVKVQDHTYQVMFDANSETATVGIEDILPLESSPEDDDDRSAEGPCTSSDADSDDELPMLLWQPGTGTMAMGEWEAHTRGIGSKLMMRMGYVVGQGLGKNGEGRSEPVPIQLLPSGKSLDKIMELKELAADKDLYDVMKRQKRKQGKIDKTAEKSYKKISSSEKRCVFDFINKKLGGKKGNVQDLVVHPAVNKKSSKVHHISESDLKHRSDRQINIQMLKTHEEIKSVQKEIVRLKEALNRNSDRKEHVLTSQLEKKITSMEEYLRKLQASDSTLQSQRKSRSDHKKLTIF